ncbi:MAG: guanylyl cyclase, partial [Alphaproteobacteria bacterium]
MDIALEDMGEIEVKNIARPVRVFRYLRPGTGRVGGLNIQSKKAPPWLAGVALVSVLAALIAGGGFWWFAGGGISKTPPPIMVAPDGKPSIAVLPFDNLSSDKEQEYFADGISEDIITDLSKISGLVVIARNSSFQFKGRKFDIKDVARKLGVRYILEGSVRRGGDTLRINVQLIDGETGAHLWADRYDGSMRDIFSLQDQVTAKIVSALAVTLTAGERARVASRETESVAAHDAFLRGWSHYIQTTPEDYVKAVPFFEKALARDPKYARVHAALAALFFAARDKNWHLALDATPDDLFEQAIAHRDEALKRPSPLAYQVSSAIALEFRKHDKAIVEADKAIALDANDPAGYVAKTKALILAGRAAEAVPLIERAMRLDPNFSADVLYNLGLAKFGAKDYPGAAAVL